MNELEKKHCAPLLEIHDMVYAVCDERAAGPYAIFVCSHCAQEYMDSRYFHKPLIQELPFDAYIEFFRNARQGIEVTPGV